MENKGINKGLYDFLSMFFIIIGNYLIYSTLGQMIKIIVCTSFVVLGSIMTLIPVIKKIKNKEYTRKQLWTVLIVGILAMPVWHRPVEIYVSMLLALRYINEDIRKMIKYIFFASVISYAAVVIMWGIGVTTGVIFYRGDILRYGIGFNNPNVAVRFLVPIIISGALMSKNNRLFLILSLIAGALGFLVTNSRGGCFIVVVFCALSLLPKKVKKFIFNIKAIPYMYVACVAVSLAVALYLNSNNLMNEIFSLRPEIWKVYLDNFKVFGQVLQAHELPVDNVFLHTLYYGGVYGLIFYTFLYFIAFCKTDFRSNYNVVILFVTIFLYGLVENHSNQGESFYLLLIMIQLLDYKKLKELDDDYKVEEKAEEVKFVEETI